MDGIITLDYGSGGGKTASLISEMIEPALRNEALSELSDGAVVGGYERLVISTDSFVVNPVFFPGGDIGKLAVCGTVNDVCMAGGDPRYLTLSFIIEEGLPVPDLQRIIGSVSETARQTDVKIVTGDTKVVERGRGDGIYINTTGVGFLKTPGLSVRRLRAGDAILVSGEIGDHGTAVMLARNPNLVSADLVSDCAPVNKEALALGTLGEALRIMRDPTRGGLATTLNEFVDGTPLSVELDETKIPVRREVRMVSEMLGLDPLYAACEGRLIAVVDDALADEALKLLHENGCPNACRIGRITDDHPGKVIVRTAFGSGRIVTRLSGDQLPRIC